ncbi:MAG: hypothetical protein K8T90_08450 [Planctomycetes bacterium]|nr:hypothetical protein [Planctomycetota bacterium]
MTNSHPTSGALVLALHDDARTIRFLRGVLEAEGFRFASAESPFRLLDVTTDAAPDLLLLGLSALDERDLELVGVLRRRWPAAVILVLFPAILRDRAARCLELGADGYLPEPFYPGELAALARRALVRLPASRSDGALGALPAPTDVVPVPPSPTAPLAPDDEALSKLAAGVAHTIRNPLQILELQIGSYESDGSLDAAGIREQLARIAAVAESLTRFSGRRKLNTRLIDVNALIQRVFSETVKDGRTSRLRLCSDRLETLGAPDLLRAATDAVRDRAQRVTPSGGTIEVSSELVTGSGDRFAEIVVTDGGTQLAADRLAALFDPFPEADHVVDGSGMEMAAAAGIVRNHGGSVHARAAAQGGTSVILRLPVRGRAGGSTMGGSTVGGLTTGGLTAGGTAGAGPREAS